MPSRSISLTWAATMSVIVRIGKREPQGLPSGAGDDGPVLPAQPPITLLQMTK